MEFPSINVFYRPPCLPPYGSWEGFKGASKLDEQKIRDRWGDLRTKKGLVYMTMNVENV